MRFASVMLILTSVLIVPVGASEDAKGDKEKIQGVWTVVSVHDGGKKRDIEDGVVTIDKDKVTSKRGDKLDKEFTYEMDPTQKPTWIDLTAGDKKMLGIYELKGDNLKICLNEVQGGERPTEFVSKAGSPNDLLIVLKRNK
jgi:uncharacterized protein (TIGR03067 family)